jgi:hypothetical protein
MKIKYLDCLGKHKLFSFYTHDYKEYTDLKGNYFMIDGGQVDYQRYSHPILKRKKNESPIKEVEISEVIEDIREQFKWTKRFDKDNRLLKEPVRAYLKDLESDHILGILKYFTDKLTDDFNISKEWKLIHLIFIEELLWRKEKETQKPAINLEKEIVRIKKKMSKLSIGKKLKVKKKAKKRIV